MCRQQTASANECCDVHFFSARSTLHQHPPGRLFRKDALMLLLLILIVGGVSCRDRRQTSRLSAAVQPFLLPSQQTTALPCRRATPRLPDVCVAVCACACLTGIACHGASVPGGGRVKQLRRDWRSSPRHRSNVSDAVASSAMCRCISCCVGGGE